MRQKRLNLIEEMVLAHLSRRPSPVGKIPSYKDWIKTVRTYLRMTQVELAKRAGITQSHLAGIEAGKVDPQVGTLKKIFGALSCDLGIEPRPKTTLGDILRGRAREIALKRLTQSMGSAALGGQAPDKDVFLQLLEAQTDRILHDRREKLWGESDE